ncbi:uncharacterized protein LOC110367754 isoform X2 [Fundulus heteroclitus]|uniref:uncharacterized protein LOC110367754 isoform X2 n=1 Tax=Fundulus heteroclitus TaxID=8078 RepID=UPI00165B7C78|nr:uncharacterized protein LOC110367754 isoform X2 [Fundulus heteroclitus]
MEEENLGMKIEVKEENHEIKIEVKEENHEMNIDVKEENHEVNIEVKEENHEVNIEVKEENHEVKEEDHEIKAEVKQEEYQDLEPHHHSLDTTNETKPGPSFGSSDLQRLNYKIGVRKIKSKTKGSLSGTPDEPHNTMARQRNTAAEKTSRKIEIGWLHLGSSGYSQVRTNSGGGTRKATLAKTTTVAQIVELGKELFFPGGLSTKGPAEDFTFDICDFKMNKIPFDNTVGQMYKQTTLKLLRFYICTKEGASTDHSSEENDPPEDGSQSVVTDLQDRSCSSDSDGSAQETESRKSIPDSVWMSRLRSFAATGSWPAEQGNRPAPRQEKWYQLYHMIEKCPVMQPGHKSLFGGVRRCFCGFHTQKQPSPTRPEAAAAALGEVHEGHKQQPPPNSSMPPSLCTEDAPPEDERWITQALFKIGSQDDLQLWYYPPQPGPLYHQPPSPERFSALPLFLWMPYRLWEVKLVCPSPACGGHQLTGAGLHRRARRVLDVDRIYIMVTERLTCTRCKASQLSWSQAVLQQLDVAHRSEFRVIMTQKYACDVRVVRLLRGRGFSPTQVLQQLRENHSEERLLRVSRYTTECLGFLQRQALLPVTFPEPPEPEVVPSCQWLLSVYSQDILTRLDDIKAHITSTYGTILKMESTKKVPKKLAGTAEGSGLWLSSVGNEHGQILISVLTAQEGAALDRMARGLVQRYQQAGVDPPVVLYVDSGCCAGAAETTRFSGWPQLVVRLDVWHFMQRLALGCTSDAHQLYPLYMSRMSACIFEWDAADLALLREAKAQQLVAQGLPSTDVDRHLTREELALHCRRRTRGVDATFRLLEELIAALMGPQGNDSLGVPLFDQERMQHIWRVQRKHVKCIQDPAGVALYTKTGELTKGGVRLPVFRCARGSTSLESFHLHLNRFIPGTSANSLNFQAYLLEGLHRWNQDRRAGLATKKSSLCHYSGDLLHSVNQNYQKLFGRKLVPEFCPPARYTGELIGLQYLFQQTGQPLLDMNPDSEETARLVEEHDVGVSEEDEGFSELTADPTVMDLKVSPTRLPSSKSEAGDSSDETMAVDDQKVPGHQHIDRLADYLVGLRLQTSLRLTDLQADRITELWQRLDDGDKQRVVKAERHQERLLTGRLRSPKKRSKTPEVESPTRCVLAAGSAPAQRPDCCRLVEAIFIRLCGLHPAPKRKGKGAESRWSLILRDYHKIRELVVGNARVMQGTDIQLVEVTQNSLVQWNHSRQQEQERSGLLQGTAVPPRSGVSKEPLKNAVPAQDQHRYQLPERAPRQERPRQASLPEGAAKRPLYVPPVVLQTPAGQAPSAAGIPQQAFTQAVTPVVLYQVVMPAEVQRTYEQPRKKRPYKRTVQANTCKKCGLFRTVRTGHSHYRGKVYCPQTEVLTKQQWLEEMRKEAR